MTPSKTPENSVTNDIIRKIHLTLANYKSGEEVLEFLRSTEPIFMFEVNRFIQTEIERMKSSLNESQALYIGSILGAAYIAGFLIAREVNHQLFNNHFDIKKSISHHLDNQDIEKIIDKGIEGGRSYKEIAKIIEGTLRGDKSLTGKKELKTKMKKRGKRLDLGELE